MKTIISAKAVALMASGNFNSGFSSYDLNREKFNTSFEAEFDGCHAEVFYTICFTNGKAERLDVEVWLYNGDMAELSGNYSEAMSAGIANINDFMSAYNVATIQDYDRANRYDDFKDDIFERMRAFEPCSN